MTTRCLPFRYRRLRASKRFRVGDVVFRGVRPCAPSGYLEKRIGPGLEEALRGRAGLRADVVEAGVVRVGDAIEAC